MNISTRLFRWLSLPLMMILLGMVLPISNGSAARLVNTDLLTTTQTLTPTATITSTPTSETVTPVPSVISTTDGPVVDGDFVNIVFPTPGPVPKSAWRPPLYPAPWAASEHDHFYFQRPIAADTINWPVADYRYGGIFFRPDVVHTGVDIDAPDGTPVLAAADGRVVWVGYGLFSVEGNMEDPYGLAVAIRHEFGSNGKRLYTVYAHMRATNVFLGQQLKAGDQIGEVGETGATTGPHLHFEVRLGRNYFFDTRNPELWMVPPQGWGVLVGSITDKRSNFLTHKEITIYALDNNREWLTRTYGPITVNSDDYFRENLVLSDLPAGRYKAWMNYEDKDYYLKFEIHPGEVTQIVFTGDNGFSLQEQGNTFTPVPVTPLP